MGNRWENSGNCQTLFFWPPKSLQMVITAMKLKRLLLGSKVMTNLDSILKSRDITLPTKVRLVKAMVFPVVMYGCESWTVKKAKHPRIDAFELWCWRSMGSEYLLEMTARTPNLLPSRCVKNQVAAIKPDYFLKNRDLSRYICNGY